MAEAIMRMTFSGRKTDRDLANIRDEVLNGLNETKANLDAAFSVFNAVCDPDLIDACIYRINMLQARYSYYLGAARSMGIEEAPHFRHSNIYY